MKKVLINVEERELRVAILEDEQLVELYIESLDEKSILNNIYKGRVEDVLPGLKAAFVNIGLDRNAFLHFDDVRPDLVWGKYREMNPEMADEVPTAREALAESEGETEGESELDDGKRKRRRGRRGGKKRRPDAEDTYSPGLPVGVTEDDLEDDEEDDTDNQTTPATTVQAPPHREAPAVRHEYASQRQQAQPAEAQPVSSQAQEGQPAQDQRHDRAQQGQGDLSPEEFEARKLARMEKQKQRRERWEQKKLERQQRRQQERAERSGQQPAEPRAPDARPTAAEPRQAEVRDIEPVPAAVYGTRGAASAYDTYTPVNAGNQRRQMQQNKARYGDNFGNIATPQQRRNDHRDSQVDFFGPAAQTHEEEHSIWDDRQPNLGPVPGAGKAFLPDFGGNNRGNDRRGGTRRPANSQQQQQNRDKKFTSGNKRRGGKKRTMRKRDNRSYFSFSADDIIENDQPLNNESAAEQTEAPKKTTRRKTAAAADGEEAPKKKTTTRAKTTAAKTTAAKTTTAKKTPAAPKATTRKKKTAEPATPKTAQEAVVQELPLDVPATDAASSAKETPAAPKKTTRARKTPATPRTRKTAAKAEPAEGLNLETALDQTAASAVEKEEAVAPAPVAEAEAGPAAPEATSAPVKPTESEASSQAEQAEQAEQGAASTTEQPQRRRNSRPTRAERAARHRAKRAEAKAVSDSATDGEQQPATDNAGAQASAESDKSSSPAETAQPTTAVVPAEKPRQQQGQQRREQRNKLRRPQFQEVFKKGDLIMVQVVKEEIGMKGARISSYVSLPGRYLVLLPYPNQEGGISRKVEDIRERKRLKNLLRDISTDETAFIVRTAGVYQEEKEIRDDVEFLSQEWGTIANRYSTTEPTSLVYDDHDILYRLARDVFDDSVAEILIDSHTEHDKLKQILGKLIPGLVDKVKLYSGAENIFHKFGVTKQIQKAARRKVWLKSGGYLIIDEAEALTAIDVNTGKSVGKDDQEKLILRTNLESARAVARELKLRDIGGLIVIDFIDMKDARNKEQVLSELKLQLRKDRSKTSVSAISEFGLVEMTRKRVRRSLRKTLFMDCPYCQGAGVVLNEQQIWLHLKHEVVRQLESTKPAPTLSITVNPRIRAYIDQNYRDVIRRLEQKYDTEIRFSMSDIFHIENYQIEAAETSGVISGSATMPTR